MKEQTEESNKKDNFDFEDLEKEIENLSNKDIDVRETSFLIERSNFLKENLPTKKKEEFESTLSQPARDNGSFDPESTSERLKNEKNWDDRRAKH